MTIPGPPAEVAEDIKAVGVEGAPPDPKAGPGRLLSEMGIGAAVVIAFAIGLGIWFGWPIGVAVLAIGALGLVFNPVFGAAAERAKDTKTVADQRTGKG